MIENSGEEAAPEDERAEGHLVAETRESDEFGESVLQNMHDVFWVPRCSGGVGRNLSGRLGRHSQCCAPASRSRFC